MNANGISDNTDDPADDGKNVDSHPVVDVAAVLILRGDLILVVYNDKWGAFSLPMSKIRPWERALEESQKTTTYGRIAAFRAAYKLLGRIVSEPILPLHVCESFVQSEHDGTMKNYNFWLFKMPVSGDTQLIKDVKTEWLTAEALLDENRGPISSTARRLIAEVQSKTKM